MSTPLGTIANNLSQREKQPQQRASKEYQKRLKLRYKRQNIARRILGGQGGGQGHRHRTCDCLRKPIPTQMIELVKSGDTAHYRGLQICGSVWSCPVCSARISEKRRKQLTVGVNKSGYHPVMVTCTLSHGREHKLQETLDRLLSAWNKTITGAWWAGDKRRGLTGFKATYDLDYWIRSLEPTYGLENGWHPHLHVLFLLPRAIGSDDLELLEDMLRERWAVIVASLGGYANEHGIDVVAGNEALAQYVAKTGLDSGHEIQDRDKALDGKWTVAHEMAKSTSKTGTIEGHYTPLQLLDLSEKHAWARQAWLEYAETMKGKKQMSFSKGCKDLLGIDDLTEEELAEVDDTSDESIEIVEITQHEWKILMEWNETRVKRGRDDVRSLLIETIMRYGAQRTRLILNGWKQRRAMAQVVF